MVEIFVPLDLLQRVEVVDTPGLNSLRPEHEAIARGFLTDADAIVWLFAVGQVGDQLQVQDQRQLDAAYQTAADYNALIERQQAMMNQSLGLMGNPSLTQSQGTSSSRSFGMNASLF